MTSSSLCTIVAFKRNSDNEGLGGAALRKSCLQTCHLQIPSLIRVAGKTSKGRDWQPGTPCPPYSRWSEGARAHSSHEASYGSSFGISQSWLPRHRQGLELIWSQVKACKAPGVDGTHSLNSLFEEEGGKPLHSFADSAGQGSWPS